MKKPELRPFPGQEPERDKAEFTVFDRCKITRRAKLFDEEPLSTVEERPYTLKRCKRLPRPFLSPTGEVVMRLRGGRGFTPIYPPWSPAGLLELEATTLMAMPEPGPEAEINLQDYGAKRRVRMRGGKVRWLDGQQSADRQKPGPKPQLGIALSARLRKVKQRCKARGVPFVLADHIKPKELIHDHGTRSGADGH